MIRYLMDRVNGMVGEGCTCCFVSRRVQSLRILLQSVLGKLDYTAEGLQAVLYLRGYLEYVLQTFHAHPARHPDELSSFTPKLISKQRMHNAMDVMLSLQNSDGGFASYNLIRGPSGSSCLTLQGFSVRESGGVSLQTCLKLL